MAGFYREAFDQDGTLYYSAERFDDFYMGKASTYPDLFGCVGILFEQASSRGARQDTATGRHAAGGDDHEGPLPLVDRF